MSDRMVRVLHPKSLSDKPPQLFSAYLSHNNIVLLGDPGAGKTHLFEHFAQQEKAVKVLARNFLNRPEELLKSSKKIYIDALDERRAGRGDNDTIDAIVSKLHRVKPDQVRISCRAVDWLGEADLVAFQDYFDITGDSVVLHLLPLNEDECLQILGEFEVENASDFLGQARSRGLQGFLENPQSLKMLIEVVKGGVWPESRYELYEKSTDILLTEANLSHNYKAVGNYPLHRLKEVVGEVFAIRLISDIDGISVKEVSDDVQYPSYKDISLSEPSEILAVLNRRIFFNDPQTNTADYTHRTIAEFLAAKWIAHKVNQGLPLSRLRALIGVDGKPVSELRGFQSWLPNFLNAGTAEIINSDPYGVLRYGDINTLSLSNRKVLLNALANLSEKDPYFRYEHWSTESTRGLSTGDMEQEFRRILVDGESNFSLRSLVLDAMSSGKPIFNLNDVLESIFLDGDASFYERSHCLNVWVNFGEIGLKTIAKVYRMLGESPAEIRLRSDILVNTKAIAATPAEVANLINIGINSKEEMDAGNYYWLDEVVADNEIHEVLNKVEILNKEINLVNINNCHQTMIAVDALLTRYIERDELINPHLLLKWLKGRASAARSGINYSQRIAATLDLTESALNQLIQVFISEIGASENIHYFLNRLSEVLVHTAHFRQILDVAFKSLLLNGTREDLLIYELCISLAFSIGSDAFNTFSVLAEIDQSKKSYTEVFQRYSVEEITDWRVENAQRKNKRKKEAHSRRTETTSDFLKFKSEIVSGNHVGFLSHVARLYFGHFDFSDFELTPLERVADEIGFENAKIAISGLVAFIETENITKFEEILKFAVQGQMYWSWYAILAGLKEYSEQGLNLKGFDDETLKCFLAIEYLTSTYEKVGSSKQRIVYEWKTNLFNERPQLAFETLYGLAKYSAQNKSMNLKGIDVLLNTEVLKPFTSDLALSLLTEYDYFDDHVQELLFQEALKRNSTGLLAYVNSKIEGIKDSEKIRNYHLYLAAGFYLSFDRYKSKVTSLETQCLKTFVWSIRDVGRYSRYSGKTTKDFTIEQLEQLIVLAAGVFPHEEHRSGISHGNQNPWDASDFIKYLIDTLSSLPSDESTQAFDRLSAQLDKQTGLSTYQDHLKHAQASQLRRVIDSKYSPPNWKQVLSTLSNLRPANMADMHALVLFHLRDLQPVISGSNTDIYKRFWNEGARGKLLHPKVEDSGRYALVDLLRARLGVLGISVEPEGHMLAEKRADIVITLAQLKLVVEVKQDSHPKVWSAAEHQLDGLYTRDPETEGYGILLVLWYGEQRKTKVPKPPLSYDIPESASIMQSQLVSLIPSSVRSRLEVFVLDVSLPVPKNWGNEGTAEYK
jgi:hypothetical protein